MWRIQRLQIILMTFSLSVCTHLVAETNGEAALAQELTNPIANLITVPVQINFDRKMGRDGKGDKFFMNVQPVIAVDINEQLFFSPRKSGASQPAGWCRLLGGVAGCEAGRLALTPTGKYRTA